MIKKCIFYSAIILIVTFLSVGFKPFELQKHQWFQANIEEKSTYLFPAIAQEDYLDFSIPYTGKFFVGFKEALAFQESQGKYKKINSLGYMGKYQFGKNTLKSIGIHDEVSFLNNPKLQEQAFITLLSKNKWELKNEINRYSGKIIDGVTITESGILAAAHLGGIGSVKKFFKSNGEKKCKDHYGASVKTYLIAFSGYQTEGIVARNKPKVE